MRMKNKIRIDQFLVQSGKFATKNKAQAAIMTGNILVDGIKVDKCGTYIDPASSIDVLASTSEFVGRGGEKLTHALDTFGVNPCGLVALDVGASTGGFTDCLLKRGVKLVYAIDVGYGQMDIRVRKDPRVIPIERTNARYLSWDNFCQSAIKAIKNEIKQGKDLNGLELQPAALVVMDVSFISITKILPALRSLLHPGGQIVSLVKPQFEAGRDQVGKGGIIRDPDVHAQVIRNTTQAAIDLGYVVHGTCNSPIKGTMGNQEFFIHLLHPATT